MCTRSHFIFKRTDIPIFCNHISQTAGSMQDYKELLRRTSVELPPCRTLIIPCLCLYKWYLLQQLWQFEHAARTCDCEIFSESLVLRHSTPPYLSASTTPDTVTHTPNLHFMSLNTFTHPYLPTSPILRPVAVAVVVALIPDL
jgi:hypothetical protein